QIGNLARLPLSEKRMYQRGPLRRFQTFNEEVTLTLEPLGQRQRGGRLYRSDAAQRRKQSGGSLDYFSVPGGDQRIIINALQTTGLLAGTARRTAFLNHPAAIGQARFQHVAFKQFIDDMMFNRLDRTDG